MDIIVYSLITNNEGGNDMMSQDGFFNDGHTTKFYLKQLAKLGCTEMLMELAQEITSGKPVDVTHGDMAAGDIETQQIFWDGATLRIYESGEWGFHRVHIEPGANGYVDFGFGYTE